MGIPGLSSPRRRGCVRMPRSGGCECVAVSRGFWARVAGVPVERAGGEALVGQEGRGVCEERQKTLFFAAAALKLTALLRRGRELEARNHPVNLRAGELGTGSALANFSVIDAAGTPSGGLLYEATTRRSLRGSGVHIDNI